MPELVSQLPQAKGEVATRQPPAALQPDRHRRRGRARGAGPGAAAAAEAAERGGAAAVQQQPRAVAGGRVKVQRAKQRAADIITGDIIRSADITAADIIPELVRRNARRPRLAGRGRAAAK